MATAHTTTDERLALRNAATLAQAQSTWDFLAEPEGSDDIDERIYAIEAAEELLALARTELCKLDPKLSAVDQLMADAANCLISE